MILLDISLPSPEKNLALDEALLLLAEKNDSRAQNSILRFWQSNDYFVVLGLSCDINEDVNIDFCNKNNIKILRRISGGGTVVQGVGCLNYSLIMPYSEDESFSDIRKSYKIILHKISQALTADKNICAPRGISDIALGQLKISGNAQSRKRNYFLHHGTILYDFNIDLISNVLKEPKTQPEYRQKRTHKEFICNYPKDFEFIKKQISEAFVIKNKRLALLPKEESLMNDLVKEKYIQNFWNFRI